MNNKIATSFFLMFFCVVPLLADGLNITPAKTEIVIKKEMSQKGSYSVINTYSVPVDVAISARTWNNSPENKDVKVEDWFKFFRKSLRLQAGEKGELRYEVSSKNFTGSLSAMVSFTVSAPGTSGLSLMSSVPIYMTIDGTQTIGFMVSGMSVQDQRQYNSEDKRINVSYTVKNDGNIPLRFSGTLKVLKGKKTIVEQGIGEQPPVYAGLERTFYERLAPLPKGKYVLNVSLNAFDKTAEKSIQFRVNKYGDVSF
ncbi:MAG: hypothetical protein LBR69_03255 [Endomicrobium sp.]|jgi:hypothetical protein|nr:hypothetical protein [Endomicrobium sp.]